jgi:hypothetical protein
MFCIYNGVCSSLWWHTVVFHPTDNMGVCQNWICFRILCGSVYISVSNTHARTHAHTHTHTHSAADWSTDQRSLWASPVWVVGGTNRSLLVQPKQINRQTQAVVNSSLLTTAPSNSWQHLQNNTAFLHYNTSKQQCNVGYCFSVGSLFWALHVRLCRALYGSVGLCMALYGSVRLCMAL